MERPRSSHPSRQRRLVVESDDPALAVSDFACFTGVFDVVSCSGPRENDPCPAIEGESCPVVQGSDVVLNQLSDPQVQRAVVDGVHATSPGVPMVVGMTPGAEFSLPDGCVPLTRSASVNGQLNALRRAATKERRT